MSYKKSASKQVIHVQELRRSGGHGFHENRRPRQQAKRRAIQDAMS